MKFIIPTENKTFSRLEFWAVTSLYILILFVLVATDEKYSGFQYYFLKSIEITLLYVAFLLFIKRFIPELLKRHNIVKNLLLLAGTFVLFSAVFGVIDTYTKQYVYDQTSSEQEAHLRIFGEAFEAWFAVLWVFTGYTVVKYIGFFLLEQTDTIASRYKFVNSEGLFALVIWFVVLFLFFIGDAEWEIATGWALVVPSGIILYSFFMYFLLPRMYSKRFSFFRYLFTALFFVLIWVLAGYLIMLVIISDDDFIEGSSAVNFVVQLFITIPLSWLVFKYKVRGKEEVYSLKEELGKSSAKLDFLRSQINPHFLFNALNTLYGTAIQENAERTSEGIQRLGDMMRFMLQENMQEKISLSREIEYLNNYILLQKLRTDGIPTVKINTRIEENVHLVQIAPMLLIPFVENAFKHGISFRETSDIRISLDIHGKSLNFDVSNSVHQKNGNDPEKDKSGIGLENVKERLKLLYPGKHELIIRETGKEFFVHLTLSVN
jgi:two-component system, LytTR family, sensor kinase